MALIKIIFCYDAKPECLLIMGDGECVTKKSQFFGKYCDNDTSDK